MFQQSDFSMANIDFRIVYIIYFDVMRNLWCLLLYNIAYLWRFMRISNGNCLHYLHCQSPPTHTSSMGMGWFQIEIFTASSLSPAVFFFVREKKPFCSFIKKNFEITAYLILQIVLHDPGEFPPVTAGGFVVSPGFDTQASVLKTKIKELPKPYESSDCLEEKPALRFFETYSPAECWDDCKARYLFKRCGCYYEGLTC